MVTGGESWVIKTIYNIISMSKLHKDDYLTHLRTLSTHTL